MAAPHSNSGWHWQSFQWGCTRCWWGSKYSFHLKTLQGKIEKHTTCLLWWNFWQPSCPTRLCSSIANSCCCQSNCMYHQLIVYSMSSNVYVECLHLCSGVCFCVRRLHWFKFWWATNLKTHTKLFFITSSTLFRSFNPMKLWRILRQHSKMHGRWFTHSVQLMVAIGTTAG